MGFWYILSGQRRADRLIRKANEQYQAQCDYVAHMASETLFFDDLTKNEQKLIIHELAERCRDIVYIKADQIAADCLKGMAGGNLFNTHSQVILSFQVLMCRGDILQVLARKRRGR